MTSLSTDLSYVTTVASRAPLLPRDQELALARRFRESGDQRAADLLARAHLRLVIRLAVKYRHYGIAISELVAEGNCGLVTALKKFDPERGIRFATYAKHWVRAHILAYVIGEKSGAMSPKLFFKLRRERARIAALFGDGVEADEALAQRMNLSIEELQRLLGELDVRGVSLDAPPARCTSGRIVDTLASSDDPEQQYYRCQQVQVASSAVALALRELDARERLIAERRIMAAGSDELTLTQLAREMGISCERVRQLEGRTKQKLGRSLALFRHTFSGE